MLLASGVATQWAIVAVAAGTLLAAPDGRVADPRYVPFEPENISSENRERENAFTEADRLPLDELIRRFETTQIIFWEASSNPDAYPVPVYRRNPLGRRMIEIAERGTPGERVLLRAHVEGYLRNTYPKLPTVRSEHDNLFSIGSKELYPYLLAKMDRNGDTLACIVAAAKLRYEADSEWFRSSLDQVFLGAMDLLVEKLHDEELRTDSRTRSTAIAEYLAIKRKRSFVYSDEASYAGALLTAAEKIVAKDMKR